MGESLSTNSGCPSLSDFRISARLLSVLLSSHTSAAPSLGQAFLQLHLPFANSSSFPGVSVLCSTVIGFILLPGFRPPDHLSMDHLVVPLSSLVLTLGPALACHPEILSTSLVILDLQFRCMFRPFGVV